MWASSDPFRSRLAVKVFRVTHAWTAPATNHGARQIPLTELAGGNRVCEIDSSGKRVNRDLTIEWQAGAMSPSCAGEYAAVVSFSRVESNCGER
jgi:hypothetical protein